MLPDTKHWTIISQGATEEDLSLTSDPGDSNQIVHRRLCFISKLYRIHESCPFSRAN